MSYVIETSGLSKWYGNVLGLSDVTLGVESGVTGLLGPNGAGKSTLLKLITGQLKPNIGEVRIYGQKIWNNYSLYSRIGFCPEQDSFYEELSGCDFLVNLIKLHNGDEEEEKEKANSALNVVELLPVKDRVIRSYSRGMRQRLKFAQAIAHDPDVLILDEPLNGLDPLGRRRIIRLIKELGAAGKTILVSSHILPEIEAMTKKIILIHQ
ncbi:MAG: ABC transporter ATP-binding protein [Acidobacteriota bacterium]